MAQWSDSTPSNKPDFSQFFKEEYGVILLRGKNSFGDHIYSYVKVSFSSIDRLVHALKNRLPFNPSDFGEVVAAGRGEPTAEVKAEVGAAYPLIEQQQSSGATISVAPAEKKSWDEY